MTELAAEFKTKMGELDKFIKDSNTEVEATGKLAKENVKELEKVATELKGIGTRITEVEQKIVEGVKKGTVSAESLGMLFAKSDAVRDFMEGKNSKVTFECKDGVFYKNTITNADATTPPDRQPGIIPGAFRQLKLRDVVPVGQTSLNVIETTRELANTNSAAETAEGSSKPESSVTFELVTTNIRTIAHWLKMSTQILADAPTVASYVDLRLAHGVEKRIDSQILNGDATGSNLSGMTKSGNFTAYTPVSGISAIDTVATMLGLLEVADYSGTGIIMNPKDWWDVQKLKGSTNDHYLYGDPHNGPSVGLWGRPVVSTNAMTQGKILVADFSQAYFYWNRQGTVVQMFEQDDVNVQKNLVTLRGEARGALETRVPAAALYGSITL